MLLGVLLSAAVALGVARIAAAAGLGLRLARLHLAGRILWRGGLAKANLVNYVLEDFKIRDVFCCRPANIVSGSSF